MNTSIIQRYFLLSILAFTAVACTHDHDADADHDHDEMLHDEHGENETHEEGIIQLTREQINTMKIKTGTFSKVKVSDYISATGTLGLPPNALTSVSAKAAGFIVSSNKYVEGNYVKKGVVLALLENPAFIQQQQQYLEVKAALTYDQQELERQQALLAAAAGVESEVQRLEAQVAGKTATLQGLARQLGYLGIGVKNLTPDKIVQRVPIYAPMSGYLTSIKMHNGMYVQPEMELMEIVNEEHLHLELDIFEKDIAKVEEGQRISYSVPAMGEQSYPGEVHVIGKEFNRNNKTVRVHGHLEVERPSFIKDLFVEAKIWLNDHTAQALPDAAIIKDGASSYIYVTSPMKGEDLIEFEALRVVPGTTSNGYTAVQLLDTMTAQQVIVTEGAYYVYAQSKAGKLEHSH